MNRKCISFRAAAAVLCLWVVSCQQTPPATTRGVGMRNYSDAVVSINQVDPAYRAYFRAQDAANYSLSDQRRAYYAAARTASTPVRASDYHPGDVRRVAKSSDKRTVRKNSSSVRKTALTVRRRVTRGR